MAGNVKDQPGNIDFNAQRIAMMGDEILKVAKIMGDLATASSRERKELEKQKHQEEQKIKLMGDGIQVGEESLGEIKRRKAEEEGLSKTWKENLKVLREVNASEMTLKIARNKASQAGADLSITYGDIAESFNKFKKGKITWDTFVKDINGVKGAFEALGGTLKGLLTPLALLGALKVVFDTTQMGRRFSTNLIGMGGGTPTIFGGKGGSVFDITQFTAYGQMLGKSPEESLKYAAGLASAGFGAGNNGIRSGNYTDIINASMAGMAVKERYGVSDDATTKIMHMLTFNLGMGSDKLGGAFVKLAKNVEDTNMNMPEFTSDFSDLAPEIVKYGGNINEATGLIRKFSDALVKGEISIGNFTSAFSARNEASTGGQMGFYALAKQYGIRMKGLSISPGMGMMDIAGATREWAQTHQAEALQAAIQLASKMSGPMANTPAGGVEAMRNFGSLFPEISALFSKVKVGEQENIVRMARAGKLSGGYLEDITKGTPSDTQSLLNQTALVHASTATTAELLSSVIGGGVLYTATRALDPAGSLVTDVLKGNTNWQRDMNKGWMAGKADQYGDPDEYRKWAYLRDHPGEQEVATININVKQPDGSIQKIKKIIRKKNTGTGDYQ